MAFIGKIEQKERAPGLGERLAGATQQIAPMLGAGVDKYRADKSENEALKRLTGKDFTGIGPDLKQALVKNLGSHKPSANQEKAAAQAASFKQGVDTVSQMRELIPKVGTVASLSRGWDPEIRQARQQFKTLGTSLIGLYGSTLPQGIRNQKEFNSYMEGIGQPGQTEAELQGSLDALETLFKAGQMRNELLANPGMALSLEGDQQLKQIQQQEQQAVSQLKQNARTPKKSLQDIFK